LHASEGGGAAGKEQAKHDPLGEHPNPGQSQRDSHASETSTATGKEHAKHDQSGKDSNHGQSQRDLHNSEDGAAAAKHHVKHGSSGDDFKHGQSQLDFHASDDDPAAAEPHVKNDARSESDANSSQSKHDLHEAPVNASSAHAGSSQKTGKDHATDDSDQATTRAAPELGDSFHFKNEMPAANASDAVEVDGGHGPHSVEHGLPIAEQNCLVPIEEADLIGPPHAEQSAIDHAKGAAHHLTHDLIV
jgi:hypothetical protein